MWVLISMEETRSGLNPLSNNFSKNAIEERITAIMKIKKSSILSFALALALVVCVTTAFAASAAAKNNNSISVPSIIHRDDATNKTSESALGSEDGYQSLLALKSADYLNQTVADFDKALLDWGNQHSEEHENIIQNDIATYNFPAYLTTEEKSFLALTIRASNIENSLLVKSYYGSPVIDPDLSFELARESRETDPPTWVNLMYGISYHLDPQVVTVGERDTTLANAINDIQSFWYDTDLETLAEMSSDEVLFKLNTIADDNSTNTIQLSIVENYHIFLSSSMFGEQKKRLVTEKNRECRNRVFYSSGAGPWDFAPHPTQIVVNCLQSAKEWGADRVCLGATEQGRSLYEKLGFKALNDEMQLDF